MPEHRTKVEIRRPKRDGALGSNKCSEAGGRNRRVRSSVFGSLSDLGFRVSDFSRKRIASRIITLWVLLFAFSASAATYTWTGTGFNGDTDYLWSNPMNWQGLAAPQPGEQGVALVFPNTGAPRNTTNDVVNLVLSSVLFQGANYGIHGGPNGITMTLLGAGGGGFAIVAGANNCQFGASTRLHLGSTGNMAVASGTLLTIKSRLSGVFGFTKLSPGTLSLQGAQANTFFGAVQVLDGILDLNNQGVALPGGVVIGDGNAASSPVVQLSLDDQIGDSAPVTVNNNGRLYLNTHNDGVGPITLAGGFVNTGLGGGTSSPGTLTLNGNVTNRSLVVGDTSILRGRISLGASSRIFDIGTNSHLAIPASISGNPIFNPGITKTGPGQLSLYDATNTYGGTTFVTDGVLYLGGGSQLLGTTNVGTMVSAGAQLILNTVQVGLESLSFTGTTTPASLHFSGLNSWDGPVTLAGEVTFDNPDGLGGNESQLLLDGAVTGAGRMRKIGNGWLRLRGGAHNTFTGGLYAENGNVYLEKDSASAVGGPIFIGRPAADGTSGRVTISRKDQIPNDLPITVLLTGTLDSNASGVDGLGNIVLEGGHIYSEAGTMTLLGNITNNPAAQPGRIQGRMNLESGEHIFHCDELSRLDVTGLLQGPGGVTKMGVISALHFFNTNTYAGLTHVVEGDLVLEGAGRPGSAAAGTVLEAAGYLSLRGAAVTNETLTLNPFGGYSPIIAVMHTNVWKGPVVLNGNADIRGDLHPHLIIDGPVSGSGGVFYTSYPNDSASGTLVLQGSTDNTYLGDTRFLEGTLILNKINAAAIPGNLVIGYPTNGAPSASVVCQRASQFAPVTAATLPSRMLTINPSGALHCGGFLQFVANLTMRGGAVFTENGAVFLHRDWTVLDNNGGSGSSFFGKLWLVSPFNNNTHLMDVQSNASLLLWGDISQGSFVANLHKIGGGEMGMLSSNSFDGVFTVSDGRVIAGGLKPFGTDVGPTIIEEGATLVLSGGTNTEPFTLAGHGHLNQGALVVQGSNYFNGPITLPANADIVTPANTNLVVFNGVISGPGGVTKLGLGTMRLAGNGDNSYSGITKVNGGGLDLTKTNATAIRGALEIAVGGGDSNVRYLRPDQLHDLAPVNIGGNGQLHLLGHSDSIGSLAGSGIVALLDGSLITGNDNTATTYGGLISGIGGTLTKVGTNSFTVTGNNAYTGGTFVKNGTLFVRGQQPQSAVTIQTGGTLGGTGTVGAISDLSGHVKPGVNACGALGCGGFITHSPANQFQIEIDGTTPGVNCDQLNVTGAVSLMGGTLQLAMNFPGAISNQYVIVQNDGADPVAGTFVGLPQNSTLTNNGVVFQIVYNGGDGNDVVLIQQNVANSGPQIGGIQKLNDGSIQISVQGEPNATYSVEAAPSLSPPIQWTKIGSSTANVTGQCVFTDADAAQHPVRFYRFVAP